jgi:small subunit ribosomal protein S20
MAHHKSAQKRIRRNANREVINTARKNRIRSFIRKVEEAIAAGEKDTAAAALRAAQPEIHRGINKGILHRNTAARRLSRLSTRINALS